MAIGSHGKAPVHLPDVNAKSYINEATLVADIVTAMSKAGACVVRNMFEATTAEKVIHEIQPYIADAGNYIGLPPDDGLNIIRSQ